MNVNLKAVYITSFQPGAVTLILLISISLIVALSIILNLYRLIKGGITHSRMLHHEAVKVNIFIQAALIDNQICRFKYKKH